jgi:hypothetical protein
VPDTTLINILTGAGACGVFCILFIIRAIYPRGVVDDLKEENRELKEALAAAREEAKVAVAAATATNNILAAIQLGRTFPLEHEGPAPCAG